jgi:hypothetical protein
MDTLTTWAVLVLTFPTENATARMRAWRALKAKGCAVLRDGMESCLPKHKPYVQQKRPPSYTDKLTHADGKYAAGPPPLKLAS